MEKGMIYDPLQSSISITQRDIYRIFRGNEEETNKIFLRVVLENEEGQEQDVVLFSVITRPEIIPKEGSIIEEKKNFTVSIQDITSGGKIVLKFNSNL